VIDACIPGKTPELSATLLDAGEAPRRVLRHEVNAPAPLLFSAKRRVPEAKEWGARIDILLEPAGPRCFAYRVTGGNGVRKDAQAFGHLVVRGRGDPWLQRGFPEHEAPRDGSLIMHEAWLSTRALTEIIDALLLLPETPVGKGARWESSRRIGRDGLEFVEKRSFTLERADEEAIEVAVTIEADAEPQREMRDNYVGDHLVERHDRLSGKLVLRRGAPLPMGSWRGEQRTREQGRAEWVQRVERSFELSSPPPL